MLNFSLKRYGERIFIKAKTITVKALFFGINVKDYLFCLKIPDGQIIKVEPYNPIVKEIGKKWLDDIRCRFPEIRTDFVGSGSLELPGQGDIDLIGGCEASKLELYKTRISEILGETYNETDRFAEWRFNDGGHQIDFFLSDPSLRIYKGYLDIYKALKGNKEVLERYRKIKMSADGISKRRYERIRKNFFNKAVYQYRYNVNLFN